MSARSLLPALDARSLWWPRLLATAALLACLWFAARMLWLLIAGPSLPAPQLPADAPLPVAAARPESAVPLSKWHLFGHGDAAPDLARLARQAPETPLQLVLKGTLNLDAHDGGVAIVADASGHEQGYRIGDTLPGDAQLVAIYAGRVLLRRNGVDEGLSLLPIAPGTVPPAPVSAAPMTAARPGAAPSAAAPTAAFVNPQLNFGAPSLESLRDATGTDIAELARQVNVMPVMENGRFAGVRLSVGRDSDILARTGLRTTDVITAVNGIPLDGPQRQAELLSSLRDARQVTVTVQRDGQTLSIPVGL